MPHVDTEFKFIFLVVCVIIFIAHLNNLRYMRFSRMLVRDVGAIIGIPLMSIEIHNGINIFGIVLELGINEGSFLGLEKYIFQIVKQHINNISF